MGKLTGLFSVDDQPSDFSAIPAGEYLAQAIETGLKKTKAGSGEYLEFKFAIVQGDYKGRTLWARFNLKNPNQQAENIARGEFAALRKAAGLSHIKAEDLDSDQFLQLPVVLKVAVEKRKDTGNESNVIKGFKSRAQMTQPPVAQQAEVNPAADGPAPSWSQQG